MTVFDIANNVHHFRHASFWSALVNNGQISLESACERTGAHYAANVQGIHRLQLDPMFNEEATESLAHADVVRRAVVKLGGVPVTERNPHPIVHTTDYQSMLERSLETETKAAEVYAGIIELLEKVGDQEMYDAIEQIYLAELRSLEDLRLILA